MTKIEIDEFEARLLSKYPPVKVKRDFDLSTFEGEVADCDIEEDERSGILNTVFAAASEKEEN